MNDMLITPRTFNAPSDLRDAIANHAESFQKYCLCDDRIVDMVEVGITSEIVHVTCLIKDPNYEETRYVEIKIPHHLVYNWMRNRQLFEYTNGIKINENRS